MKKFITWIWILIIALPVLYACQKEEIIKEIKVTAMPVIEDVKIDGSDGLNRLSFVIRQDIVDELYVRYDCSLGLDENLEVKTEGIPGIYATIYDGKTRLASEKESVGVANISSDVKFTKDHDLSISVYVNYDYEKDNKRHFRYHDFGEIRLTKKNEKTYEVELVDIYRD